ncbi:hypothetical protein HYU95_03260 [Candidatus Daviesbacteria bacterium]|nr:hypothetical protein [Candidatus Daviesbacteria bacterium]
MANRIEASAGRAIDAVEALPRGGQVAEEVYVGKHPLLDAHLQEVGRVVGLTALGKGAARLAGNEGIRCIILEKNGGLRNFKGAIFLAIDQGNQKGGERKNYIFEPGKELDIPDGERRLVQTVLENIAQLAV